MAAHVNNIVMARLLIRRFYPIFSNQGSSASSALTNGRSFSSEDVVDKTTTKQKISKAMKAYLERARAHDAFMKQETHQFNVGKRHLANMMGADPETFSQKDIDESIRYLFPSGLFEPKARPLMRPPEEVFPSTKAAEFDESGRPYHYLFYTTRPNYSSLLNECANKLAELDSYEDSMIREQRKPDSGQALDLAGSVWLKKEALEKKVLEKIVDVEFDRFLAALERLASHPYAYRVADFIRQFRVELVAKKEEAAPAEPELAEDGRRFVTIKDCARKSTRGTVTVTIPGTGKFTLNGHGIDCFTSDTSRNQVQNTGID